MVSMSDKMVAPVSGRNKRRAPPAELDLTANKRVKRSPRAVQAPICEPLTPDEFETLPFSPKPARFGRDSTIPLRGISDELLTLELYQAYPHDRRSALCKDHFVLQAESWYTRQRPFAEQHHAQIMADHFGRCEQGECFGEPDFSSLVLPTHGRNSLYRLYSLAEFMHGLVHVVDAAEKRVHAERARLVALTGERPRCELIGDECLACSVCHEDLVAYSEEQNHWVGVRDEELQLLREAKQPKMPLRLGCGHESAVVVLGAVFDHVLQCKQCPHSQRCYAPWEGSEFAVRAGGQLIPVAVRPKRLTTDGRTGSVDYGGLHFIVDGCGTTSMVMFRSTMFSQVHEKDRLEDEGRADDPLLLKLCADGRIFEPKECSDYFNRCLCSSFKR